jgi:hypothetical protein
MKRQRRGRGVPKAEVGSVTQVPANLLHRLPMRSPRRRLKTSAQTYRELDVRPRRRHVEERERIMRKSANYVVIGSDLYRKAASTGILMKCILRSEGPQLLAEIHIGECRCHAASTNLVGKAY